MQIRKFFYTLIFIFLLSFYSNAQTIQVLSKSGLMPIAGAEVVNQKNGFFTTTNYEGKASLSSFKTQEGFYINHVGYKIFNHPPGKKISKDTVIYLQKYSYNLTSVTISSSRFEENSQEVPHKIEKISRKEIEQSNAQTPADLLQQSGSVLVQKSQQGGGSPIIRGFEANKVLIVIDGVRMNNAIYRGGHLQNVITLDNSVMDNVEILFGAGSVIYGSDALGGVMHFTTRKPMLSLTDSLQFLGESYVRYSSANNGTNAHLNFNFGNKKWASLTSITASNYDDLRQGNVRNPFYGDWGKSTFVVDRVNGVDSIIPNSNINIQKRSGYSQYDFLQKVLYKPSQNIDHILNVQYSTSSNVPRYDRLSQVRSGLPRFSEWYYGPQNRLLTSYLFANNNKTKLYDQFKVIAAYQNIEESRHNRSYKSDVLNSRVEQLNIASLNVDFKKTIAAHTLNYGVEGIYNNVKSIANGINISSGDHSIIDTRYPDGGSEYNTFSGYATHKYRINDNLVLSDGFRFSVVNAQALITNQNLFPYLQNNISQLNRALNGNLGLTYNTNNSFKYSLLLSSGFRAPNIDDLAKVFESVAGTVIIPNSNLKPEYTYNAELSVNKSFNNGGVIEWVGYYTRYLDAITTINSQFEGQDSLFYDGQLSQVVTSGNAKQAYIYGTSASILLPLSKFVTLSSTYNYTFGRIETDTTDYPLDHIPPVFGKTSLDFTKNKFEGSFFVMYNGWKRVKDYNLFGEDNFSKATPFGTPAWYTLNLRSSYHVTEHFNVQLNIDNLLDYSYRVFASGIHAPGRNISITLRVKF